MYCMGVAFCICPLLSKEDGLKSFIRQLIAMHFADFVVVFVISYEVFWQWVIHLSAAVIVSLGKSFSKEKPLIFCNNELFKRLVNFYMLYILVLLICNIWNHTLSFIW